MIIDAHSHLGYDFVFEEDFPLKNLLAKMEDNKIDISIVQPATTLNLEDVIKQHDAIADLSKKMHGRIFGMANPNPHFPIEEYRKEMRRCIEDLGFVGVKIHPFAHAVDPKGFTGRKVFETALELGGVPVMVHTGMGIPWTLPSVLIPIAMDFPQLKIILAHCGSSMFSSEAALAVKLCPNVYLETSWVPSVTIRAFCKDLGADRVMFGSDHGENAATELTKFKTVGLSDQELEWCLGKTASKVFNIKH